MIQQRNARDAEASWRASSMRDCAAGSGSASNSKNTHGVRVSGSIRHAAMAPCTLVKCGKACAAPGRRDFTRSATRRFSKRGHDRVFLGRRGADENGMGAESTLCMTMTEGEEGGLFSNRHVRANVAAGYIAWDISTLKISIIRCDNTPQWLRISRACL